jgi:hypothetical protein
MSSSWSRKRLGTLRTFCQLIGEIQFSGHIDNVRHPMRCCHVDQLRVRRQCSILTLLVLCHIMVLLLTNNGCDSNGSRPNRSWLRVNRQIRVPDGDSNILGSFHIDAPMSPEFFVTSVPDQSEDRMACLRTFPINHFEFTFSEQSVRPS